MTVFLLRDAWIKPLTDSDIESQCTLCREEFNDLEFVTFCEFCEIGVMHTSCADNHLISTHQKDLEKKINLHRDKPLHKFQ